jgi:hypothetical protein
MWYEIYKRGQLGDSDLSMLARPIYNYLRLLALLSEYQGKYLASSADNQIAVFEWMEQSGDIPFGPR